VPRLRAVTNSRERLKLLAAGPRLAEAILRIVDVEALDAL
jgi:hypothetical protein